MPTFINFSLYKFPRALYKVTEDCEILFPVALATHF